METGSRKSKFTVYQCCKRGHTLKCASIVKTGGVIVYPTDTVYGIGCNPYLEEAVERIFEIKGRNKVNPFPILASNLQDIEKIALLGKIGKRLAKIFWPGALTIISTLIDTRISTKVTAGKTTVGVRVPDNKCAVALLKHCKYLVGTSANKSGENPSNSISEVILSSLRGFDAILDGGNIRQGSASTILDLSGRVPKIIREGAISSEEIARVLSTNNN
ncbi:MAG: threonylcarbamoyl-AMP synthase [Nitrosopumilales archaeon]|jgi:L-threonylcarbamoyladenylate synthase|nr:threonylcarbamoyl-AMP synthase [Nitrosopumilales archaeon]